MSKRPVRAVAEDFSGVLTHLTERGILAASPGPRVLENARRIHRATYSLILWRFRLKRLTEHRGVFVEEIASDALQVLPQTLMGYSKTAKLLTRGVVENVLRHVYFSDHPIEFRRMNQETKWYLSVEDLFQYASAHPELAECERRFDAINRLKTLYGELSAGVHGRRVSDLEMRVALRDITYDDLSASSEMAFAERCAESVNFILGAFHLDQFVEFRVEDRRAILQTMPKIARRVLSDLD